MRKRINFAIDSVDLIFNRTEPVADGVDLCLDCSEPACERSNVFSIGISNSAIVASSSAPIGANAMPL